MAKAPASWNRHPGTYFTGAQLQLAVADLQTYRGYDGFHFNFLADSDPNVISERDLLAVSMLSVNVPAKAAWEILHEDRWAITDLLRQIPTKTPIWESSPQDLGEGSPVWDLWYIVKPKSGVGATIASKILACKRPALVPIYDSKVAEQLFSGHEDNIIAAYWEMWRAELAASDGASLIQTVEGVRGQVGYDPSFFSVLRVIDIAVWMQRT